MKKIAFIAICLSCFSVIALQGQWARTYGGSNDNVAFSVQQTTDGGYIAAGYTNSFGLQSYDIWILKLDAFGDIVWQKTYGGYNTDYAYCVQQTNDGGYILAGSTNSFGAGGNDYWVLKLNKSGDIEWQRSYGGPQDDVARSIQQTFDGGYIVVGETYSFGSGRYDMWILKLDANGNIEWQRVYGSDLDDYARRRIGDEGVAVGQPLYVAEHAA